MVKERHDLPKYNQAEEDIPISAPQSPGFATKAGDQQ